MTQKTSKFIAIFLILILSTLSCQLFGGGGDTPPERATVTVPAAGQAPTLPPSAGTPGSPGGAETPLVPLLGGLAPGWHLYTNANVINGLALYGDTLFAATLGGVVGWELATGQAVKYTTQDGMGYIGAYDVVLCNIPDLRLVTATEKGLNFFDPVTGQWDTRQITPSNANLGNLTLFNLFCDQANQRLLIGYAGLGIYEISSGNYQQLTESTSGLAWNSVRASAAVGSAVWAVGYKGVSVIENGQVTTIHNKASGMPEEDLQTLAVGSDGTVWLGSLRGLVRYQNGQWTMFNRDNVQGLTNNSIYGLAFDPEGKLWVSTAFGEICHFDPASQTCLKTFSLNLPNRVTDILVVPPGKVFLATYGDGLLALEGESWQPWLVPGDQLASNYVNAFAEDRDGNLWIATDNGAQRLDPGQADQPWELFTSGQDGAPSKWFQKAAADPSGGMWFAHDSRRASYFNGSAWQRFGSDQGIQGSVAAIAPTGTGVTYLGTSEGLAILEGGSIRTLTDADGLPSKNVRALLWDGETLWIGTVDGLAKLENGRLEVALGPNAPGLPDDNISVIVKESAGTLLLGTAKGLARYDGNQAVTLLQPEPLRTDLFGLTTQNVSAIAIAADGTIWAGTYVGLYLGDGQTWQRLSTVDGLPTNNITALYIDRLGTVWVGGGFSDAGGGIARYVPGAPPGGVATAPPPPPATQAPTGDATATPTAAGFSGAIYDQNTKLPMIPDAHDIYSTEDSLNYWTTSSFEAVRDFYLKYLPLAGWLLDLDENGKCRDNDRCGGWHGGYDDPDNSTWFFIQGERAYLTLNLIREGYRVNVIIGIDWEYK